MGVDSKDGITVDKLLLLGSHVCCHCNRGWVNKAKKLLIRHWKLLVQHSETCETMF